MSHLYGSLDAKRQSLIALDKGMSKSKVCQIFNISPTALERWARRRKIYQRGISFTSYLISHNKNKGTVRDIPLGVRNLKTGAQAVNRATVRRLPVKDSVGSESSTVHNGWSPGFFEEIIGGWEGEPLERSPQPCMNVDENIAFDLPNS